MFHFDPALKLMSTVDERRTARSSVHAKGAPEEVLAALRPRSAARTSARPLDRGDARASSARRGRATPAQGLRVLARRRARRLPDGSRCPSDARTPSATSCFLGLVALLDPPRPEVADAVARCHAAGIRIIVVTGDHGLTAAEIARQVGIARERRDGRDRARSSTGMSERELDELLRRRRAS